MAANERVVRWQRMLEMLHRTLGVDGQYNIIAARNLYAHEFPYEHLPSRQAFMGLVLLFIYKCMKY